VDDPVEAGITVATGPDGRPVVPLPRPALSRDRVIDTALAIVDREGLDGLTMRHLASELGVEAMSLYHWFPNKAAILDALVEASLRETASAVDASSREGWRASLRALAHAHRRVLKAHPNTLPHMNSRPGKSVEAMRFIERMLDVLRTEGFTPRLATQTMQSLLAYIRGAVAMEAATELVRTDSHGIDELLERLPATEFPRVHEVAALFRGPPPTGDEQFEFGLEALLDGIGERLIGQR
jgi:TetR/AcrR family tetracycline transcriptional repressor